jgi:hypothetical protein
MALLFGRSTSDIHSVYVTAQTAPMALDDNVPSLEFWAGRVHEMLIIFIGLFLPLDIWFQW